MEATQIAEIIDQLMTLFGIIFGTDSQVLQTVFAIFAVLATIVGSASAIVAALDKIAAITPTTKDDMIVGKAKRYIGIAVAVLDRIALNPDKAKARQPRDRESKQ